MGREAHHSSGIYLSPVRRCLFAASVNINAGHFVSEQIMRVGAGGKKKGAQPLRVVGRQKRVVFARVPGGKPARANHTFG